MANKKKKRKTIGKMANSRMTWAISPVARVKPSKKVYSRKDKHKGSEA